MRRASSSPESAAWAIAAQIEQYRRFARLPRIGHHRLSDARDAAAGTKSFKRPALSVSERAVFREPDMPRFTGESVRAFVEPAVEDEPRSEPRAEGQKYEVPYALSRAEFPLGDGTSVRVVLQKCGNGKLRGDVLRYGNFIPAGKIRRGHDKPRFFVERAAAADACRDRLQRTFDDHAFCDGSEFVERFLPRAVFGVDLLSRDDRARIVCPVGACGDDRAFRSADIESDIIVHTSTIVQNEKSL